MILNNSELV